MASQRITVGIPTWNRPDWLRTCLESMARQTRLPDEVLVAVRPDDVASHDVIGDVRARAPFPVRVVDVGRPGHVEPIMRLAADAAGQLLAIVDDDIEATETWLAEMERLFADPRVAVAGGAVETPGSVARVRANAGCATWYGRHVGNVAERGDLHPVRVDGVIECNWAWRTDVLRTLEFDPVLDFREAMAYGLDLSLQAKAAGHEVVFCARPRVRNTIGPRDPASSILRDDGPAKAYSVGRNYCYLALKHRRPAQKVLFVLWTLLVGERLSPGLIRFPLLLPRGIAVATTLVAQAQAGKIAALALWFRHVRTRRTAGRA